MTANRPLMFLLLAAGTVVTLSMGIRHGFGFFLPLGRETALLRREARDEDTVPLNEKNTRGRLEVRAEIGRAARRGQAPGGS